MFDIFISRSIFKTALRRCVWRVCSRVWTSIGPNAPERSFESDAIALSYVLPGTLLSNVSVSFNHLCIGPVFLRVLLLETASQNVGWKIFATDGDGKSCAVYVLDVRFFRSRETSRCKHMPSIGGVVA